MGRSKRTEGVPICRATVRTKKLEASYHNIWKIKIANTRTI